MNFNEKLQELRKNKGLTQEDLAEALFVSRTAVSKWESGRGYPNIETLKDISKFFSVSIDDLLSGEKLLAISEKETKGRIRNICGSLFGIIDISSFMLIFLPLYPNTIDGFVYSVNLFCYTEGSQLNKIFCWVAFISLFVSGIIKLILTKRKAEKGNTFLMKFSLLINIITVLFLALSREVYAVCVAFLILIIKAVIFLKHTKAM